MKAIKVFIGDDALLRIMEPLTKEVMQDEDSFAYQVSKNELLICCTGECSLAYWKAVISHFTDEITITELK